VPLRRRARVRAPVDPLVAPDRLVPHDAEDARVAFRVNQTSRGWLDVDEATQLATLLGAYAPEHLPGGVQRAWWQRNPWCASATSRALSCSSCRVLSLFSRSAADGSPPSSPSAPQPSPLSSRSPSPRSRPRPPTTTAPASPTALPPTSASPPLAPTLSSAPTSSGIPGALPSARQSTSRPSPLCSPQTR
jgi:hypothetical protein